MFFDPLYLIIALPGILLGIWAQMKLSSAYGHYSRVGLRSGMTGAEAAREILDSAGLQNVPVNQVPGHLTDHYDPARRALFLSEENYHGQSVAAVGVAAHEAGHALQHKAAYAPMNIRMAIVPVANIATGASYFAVILGFMLHMTSLVWLGVVLFSAFTLFQLITLPVEYDASRRAKEQLLRLGLVQPDESSGVSKVLSAAALTYVAALVTAILQLLYYVSLANRSSRN